VTYANILTEFNRYPESVHKKGWRRAGHIARTYEMLIGKPEGNKPVDRLGLVLIMDIGKMESVGVGLFKLARYKSFYNDVDEHSRSI
jgi:hypothetical protein